MATFVLGGCNGLGNVIFVTLVQRWAPPRLLGRVMSVVMLAELGSFPLSVVSGVLVRHLGQPRSSPWPAPSWPSRFSARSPRPSSAASGPLNLQEPK